MSKRRTNDLERHVAVSLPKQFVLEAKSLHMSPTTYWRYLKHLANYTTPYDQILANYEAQQGQGPEPQPEPEPRAKGSGKAEPSNAV